MTHRNNNGKYGLGLARQMRHNSEQLKTTAAENFDLHIRMFEMHKAMKAMQAQTNQKTRRFSKALPEPEDYYDQEKSPSSSSNSADTPPYNFEQEDQHHQRPHMRAPSQTPTPSPPSLIGAAVVSGSGSSGSGSGSGSGGAEQHAALEAEIADVRQQRDGLEQQLCTTLAKVSQLETRNSDLSARITMAEQDSFQQSRDAASDLEQAAASRIAAESRAKQAEQIVEDLKKERGALMSELTSERGRVEFLHKAQKQMVGVDNGMERDELLKTLAKQKRILDSEEYTADWRDNALASMDLCVRLLQLYQVDVSNRRTQFVEQICRTGAYMDATSATTAMST